jgi:hypothetical protein
MNALSKFIRGVLASSLWVILWLMVLMFANMIVPLVYFDHLEAHIVLITFFLGFGLLVVLTGRFGFTRILGLGHVLWIPLVLYLISRAGSYPATDAYGLWIRSVIVLNTISVVIDTTDVVRYARGDREEVVAFD